MTRSRRATATDRVLRAARACVNIRGHVGITGAFDELCAATEALIALDPSPVNDADVPHSNDSTSLDAAILYVPFARSMRRGVINCVQANLFEGAVGCTDADLEARLRRPHQSVSSARNWATAEGWLCDSGMVRKTPSGRDAIVWTLTEAAQRHIREKGTV